LGGNLQRKKNKVSFSSFVAFLLSLTSDREAAARYQERTPISLSNSQQKGMLF
jgi:hypothetical protein